MSPVPPNDPQDLPTGQAPELTARTERALVRASAPSTRHALVEIAAPRLPRRAARVPVNLALVLDRSGSMGGGKFELARRAVEQALAQLHPEDRFALVVYDDEVDVLAPSSPATPEARRDALERLAHVHPRGSTDLAGGWLTGAEQVALALDSRPRDAAVVSRCLLLTDGLANHGLTDLDALLGHAAALRERGVQTSTFGVGEDFDERLLAGMADAGGGHFYFLADPRQIPELIESEVGEALEVVLRHAVVELRLAPGVTAEPLTRFRTRLVETDHARSVLRVELGDLVSGQQVELVVALHFPVGALAHVVELEVGLLGGEGLPCTPAVPLRWTYASDAANDAQPRDLEVDRRVARLQAERARAEALEHNRAGRYADARHGLVMMARSIRSLAAEDAAMLSVADELSADVPALAEAPLSPIELKQRFARGYNAAQSRDASGLARRRPTE